MSQPYVGEIRMFGGSFAPAGWAFCLGQLMPISENDILFTLIGTTYGGDGQETFALPNLGGRIPICAGQGPGLKENYQLGEMAGVESVTLTTQQIPVHNHAVVGTSGFGSAPSPTNNFLASSSSINVYGVFTPTNPFAPSSITPVGGSQPHENLMPYLAVNFIISLFGVFPTQT
jgi:microcystin-dependent protein